jgi:integrase
LATRIRLSEATDLYLKSRRSSCSASTVRQDAYVLRRLVRHVGDLLVHNVTPDHIERFFTGLSEEHTAHSGMTYPAVRASTWNNLYSRIKQFGSWLQQRGYLRADLLAFVRPRRPERRERQQPDTAMLWRMIESASDPRDRAVLAVAANTGLRANEIADLRIADVDLGSLDLTVRITKSRTEDRIAITADLAAELRRWLTYYAEWKVTVLGQPLIGSDYLLPVRCGPRFRWRTTLDGARERYQVDGGYDPQRPVNKLHLIAQEALASQGLETRHEGIHTIRRAVARACFDMLTDEKGYDGALRVVSSLLHHSNVSTTESYLGFTKERLSRDAHLRGRSLLGPRPGTVAQPLRTAGGDSTMPSLLSG